MSFLNTLFNIQKLNYWKVKEDGWDNKKESYFIFDRFTK